MKRLSVLLFTLSILSSVSLAQKTVYIPNEWRNPWPADSLLYKESDPDNQYTWSKSRSVESDNVIIFWDKYYGNKKPHELATSDWNYVDITDLLKKCEAFYDLEINRLGFVDPVKSNHSKYKMMVLMNYSKPGDWACYGGGYDFVISALWLNSATCKPVGHSVAHEVGHSFHYMCYAEHSGHRDSDTDNTGFHLACGNGQAIWEQTAQWQAAQSYPELMFDQSISVFRRSHNYAFSHEWHRYQSYWFHYFINQYYNDITTVAQVWNQPMTGQSRGNGTDFNQALMALKDLDATGLFRLYYDYAARCATWDIDACRSYGKPYIGDFDYRCVLVGDTAYQVALASVPQASGFNVIPLDVPAAGTTVTTHFTALPAMSKLAPGDPAEMMTGETAWGKTTRTNYVKPTNFSRRAFRLGYVALLKDGTRQYFNADSLYCEGNTLKTCEVSMVVPENTQQMWLIVVPAPTTYVQHRWDENPGNDDQWPYRFRLEGTDLGAKAQVYVAPEIDGRDVADITFTYDVRLPRLNSYDYVTVNVSGQAQAMLGTAFQMTPTDIADRMQAWTSAGPSAGQVMFYPLNPKTLARVNRGSTANGYGHWFNAGGNVTKYDNGDAYLYSEFSPTGLSFNVGQYPNRLTVGNDYSICQALRYRQSADTEATARFIFRVHVTNGDYGAQLASIDYTDPSTVGIHPSPFTLHPSPAIYDLQGRRLSKPQKGLNIINGQKVSIK